MYRAALFCFAVLLCGCATQQSSRRSTIAPVFAKAATHVFDVDHIWFDTTVGEVFSDLELEILGNHLDSLVSMIECALGRHDTVWGAKFAGHFKVNKMLPLLRYHFLTPRRCYMWEGPDYSKLESWLADNQYQYSIVYLEAIEAITDKPIADAIVLKPSESKRIKEYATNKKSEFYHWALWMQRKLKMKNRPNQRMNADQ